MTTVADSIYFIREFLHDPDGDRWSDATILRYLNLAQKDVAERSSVLKGYYRFGVRDGQGVYTLPEDCYDVTRVSFNQCAIELVGHSSFDKTCNLCWEGKQGTPQYAIKDKLERNKIRLHPIPNSSNTIILQDPDFGLSPDLGEDIFGIIVNEVNYEHEILPFGSSSEILLDDIVCEVHYSRLPKYLTLDSELEIDEDMLLQHYVCGHLLRSDKDSNSRSLGAEELNLYGKDLKILSNRVKLAFASGTVYTTKYKGIS